MQLVYVVVHPFACCDTDLVYCVVFDVWPQLTRMQVQATCHLKRARSPGRTCFRKTPCLGHIARVAPATRPPPQVHTPESHNGRGRTITKKDFVS